MDVSWIDVVVGVVLLIALIRGAVKGLVWQLAAIAAIVLCFAVSGTFSPPIARAIPVDPPLDRWLAMFGLYLASGLLCFGIGWRIRDWLNDHKLKQFDRRLGAVFGLVKGAVFVLVVMFFSVTVSPRVRAAVLGSRSGFVAAVVMDGLHPVMPEEFHDALHPYIHQLDDAASGSVPHSHGHDDDRDRESTGGGEANQKSPEGRSDRTAARETGWFW